MTSLADKTERTASLREKILSASMYAAASFAIMFVNKYILTTFHFPSFQFIAMVQCIGSLVVLAFQRWVTRSVSFPSLSFKVFKEIQPLPIIYFFNMVSGLGATKSLSMPMFVLLRRFSIPMTMGLEKVVLGKEHKPGIAISIFMMVAGALIAASGDLTLDPWGCFLILLNDVFTAANGVTTRWKQDRDKANLQHLKEEFSASSPVANDTKIAMDFPAPPTSSAGGVSGGVVGEGSIKNTSSQPPSLEQSVNGVPPVVQAVVPAFGGATTELGNHGLLFYNAVFSLPVILVSILINPKEMAGLNHFDQWRNSAFWFAVVLTSLMGFFLNYSTFLCTKLNSPLTTTVIGCLKNVFTTYLGMILFPDYTFTMLSFFGATVSVVGSIRYSWVEFQLKTTKPKSEGQQRVL